MLGARRQQSSPAGLLTKPESNQLPTATPFQRLSVAPTIAAGHIGPTTNWKTYTTSEYDISFRYPFDAKVITQTIYSMLSSKPSDGIIVEPPYQEPYSKWYSFALVVRDNPQRLDARTIIDSYIEDIRKSCTSPACETPKMILDTLKQYKNADIDGYIFHMGAETDSVMVVQVKNGRTYIFRMSGDQGNVTNYGVILFDQILSTFRFNSQ